MTRLSEVKTAIVTGGGSGMGLEMVGRLAARGTEVIAVDRNISALEKLPRVTAVALDVTDENAVAEQLGPFAKRCDLLVHAAGIGFTGRVLDTPVDTFRTLISVNYLGTVATVSAVAPAMVRRGRGHIALFASIAGWVPAPSHGPYNATKAAVIMYAEVLKLEVALAGIHVTCICPPAVSTPLLDDMPAAKAVSTGIMKPLSSARVIDAVEKAIEKDQFYVFPDIGSKLEARLRRHAPRVLEFGIKKLLL